MTSTCHYDFKSSRFIYRYIIFCVISCYIVITSLFVSVASYRTSCFFYSFSGLFSGSVVSGDSTHCTPPRSTSIHSNISDAPAEGSRHSNGGSSGTLAAIASFLSPSPSSPVTGNPLFMASQATALPSARSSGDVPKLVPHDVRLVPMPRGGPGAAVKRLDDKTVNP